MTAWVDQWNPTSCIATKYRHADPSGYHIGGFDGETHDPLLFEQIPDRLAALRPVTIRARNGSVYGGATDLVLACDLRIGLAGTELRMPATPGWRRGAARAAGGAGDQAVAG